MPTARRVFLRAQEVPALLVGVARGDPAAMRRVLGARRGGRVGMILGLLGLLLAVPGDSAPWLVAAQLALGVPGAALARPRLAWLEYERLSLWLAGSCLIAVAPLRALLPLASLPAASLALLAAHLWLLRSLRRGLGAPLAG